MPEMIIFQHRNTFRISKSHLLTNTHIIGQYWYDAKKEKKYFEGNEANNPNKIPDVRYKVCHRGKEKL